MAPASLLGVLARVILPLTEAACLCAQEGDLNMPALAKTLFEAGYKYMLMPDHAPNHPDDPGVGTPNALVLSADKAHKLTELAETFGLAISKVVENSESRGRRAQGARRRRRLAV